MIASQVISQKKYIVNNDTCVCYNKYENRKIAIIFERGEMYKELYYADSIIIKNIKLIQIEQEKQLYDYNLQVIKLKDINTYLKEKNNSLQIDNNKLTVKNKNLTTVSTILGGTSILSIILIIILL